MEIEKKLIIHRPVLTKMKTKTTIHLPGFTSVNTSVIEETPISQMSQTQAPDPHIPGMPSPHKIHGSFLNKPVSPRILKSPLKSPVSPKHAASAKKKMLDLHGFNDDVSKMLLPTVAFVQSFKVFSICLKKIVPAVLFSTRLVIFSCLIVWDVLFFYQSSLYNKFWIEKLM